MADLQQLNRDSPDNEIYKLIFLARHGQAKSNVASQKYSKEEWMRKWRFLGTDGELTWGPDADLTELGLKQAAETINAGNNNYLKVLLILNVSMFPRYRD